jgi:hypothetical protein
MFYTGIVPVHMFYGLSDSWAYAMLPITNYAKFLDAQGFRSHEIAYLIARQFAGFAQTGHNKYLGLIKDKCKEYRSSSQKDLIMSTITIPSGSI